MNLVELFDNIVQMEALNGVPLANGHMYVYALGRTRLMDTWSDIEGTVLNTNPIILDNAGQAHVYVSDDFDYTIVVCDEYNNEVFSIDKYLYSKGEHSHADVAVAPSEHIAVSSYHVGETTVYVPYIQGELGKTYHGIEPIVVNNQENKISARNIALGVQEPLAFIEDSESACIIGMTANYQTAGDYQPAGNYQTAGDYVSASEMSGYVTTGALEAYSHIVEDTYQHKGDYVEHPELSSYATKDWVNDQSYMHEYMESAFYPMESNPSGYLTEHQSLAGYMQESKLETADGKITGYDGTAFAGGSVDPSEFIPWSASGDFQEKGDYYSASNPSGFINSDAISAMATTGFVAGISGEITAMIPTALTGDYLTKDSADTLYYPLTSNPSGYLTTAEFAYYDTAISSIDNSALYDTSAHARINTLAGRISDLSSNKLDSSAFSTVSGEFATVSSKADISATIDYTNKPSANAISADDHTLYIKNEYGAGGEVLGNQSGFYVHANGTAHGFIAGAAPYDYKEQGPLTVLSYNGVSSLTKPDNPSVGLTVEAGWNVFGLTTKQAQLNTSAGVTTRSGVYQINDNKTHYLSAKQDVSGMTAYQPAGNYLTTGDSANFYTTANESGFISEVPDTYLQNTDLSTEDGKVTAISGIPLSAGGDVPEGVMVESGLEYNAVNEISGYNGSAIAQYGAEKQWLVHDDTLVHAANSAQYALGVNLSAVAQLLGVDETVLWEGDVLTNASTKTGTYAESLSAFNTIKVIWSNNDIGSYRQFYCPASSNNQYFADVIVNNQYQKTFTVLTNQTGFTNVNAYERMIDTTGAASNAPMTGANNQAYHLLKIVGIGRKQ